MKIPGPAKWAAESLVPVGWDARQGRSPPQGPAPVLLPFSHQEHLRVSPGCCLDLAADAHREDKQHGFQVSDAMDGRRPTHGAVLLDLLCSSPQQRLHLTAVQLRVP